jgi:hypothetical protein
MYYIRRRKAKEVAAVFSQKKRSGCSFTEITTKNDQQKERKVLVQRHRKEAG